ncbi:MAG: ATP-binding protein [Acetobacter indonesiensis]
MEASTTGINLPARLNLDGISSLLRSWEPRSKATLILDPDQWVDPIGLVGLACMIDHAKKEYQHHTSVQYEDCPNATYWERMEFFSCLNLPGPTSCGQRHHADGRFCELKKIGDDNDTDSITKSIVDTLGLEKYSSSWQVVHHIISEAINNVCHHAESFGFAHAQYFPSYDRVKICIGDTGIGLKAALSRVCPQLESDEAAILKALEPCVTSNPPHNRQSERRNRGVGLTTIHRLVDACGGTLHLWSGDTMWHNGVTSQKNGVWPGTLVAVSIKRDKITPQFHELMEKLHQEIAVIEKQR